MPELNWNYHEVIECLGVLPETDAYFTFHTFTATFGSIRLELTIWENESLVALSLFEGQEQHPYLSLSFIVRDRIELVTESEFSCLRFHDSVVVTGRFWMIHDEDKIDWFDAKLVPTDIGFELATYPKFEIKVF